MKKTTKKVATKPKAKAKKAAKKAAKKPTNVGFKFSKEKPKAKVTPAKKVAKAATPPAKTTIKEKGIFTPTQSRQIVAATKRVKRAISKIKAKATPKAPVTVTRTTGTFDIPKKEKSNTESQLKIVKAHLLKQKSITSWEAISLYRITRLSAIIFNLKKSGMAIKATTMNSLNGGHHTRYSIK